MQNHEEEPDNKSHDSIWKCIFWVIVIELIFLTSTYAFLEELEKELFGD